MAKSDVAVSETAALLLRWARGDQAAMAELVAADAPWVEAQVRRRLGRQLRQRIDTQDIVQNTLLGLLHHGPRFVCSDRGHLRALLARMVENAIRTQVQHATADKRDLRREARVPAQGSGSVLMLDAGVAPGTEPGLAAEQGEMRDWVRLALELLEPEDRAVILWREFDGEPFATIAARLGIAEDAARMRFSRALPRLARRLKSLRSGDLADLLGA